MHRTDYRQDQSAYRQDQSARTNARRQFLKACPAGMGTLWLGKHASAAATEMIDPQALADRNGRPPKAKHVIFLHMVGGPSQLELFDYKPDLQRRDGQCCPDAMTTAKRIAGRAQASKLLGPQSAFAQHGQSGAWVSNRLPRFSQVVDSVAFIKSMQTDVCDHLPAQRLLHTGEPTLGVPSLGSWLAYALGTENEGLPAHVVLTSGGKPLSVPSSLWGRGFLSFDCQGIRCRNQADPILCLGDPDGWERPLASEMIATISAIKRRTYEQIGDPEMVPRIAQHEMAFQMQMTAAEAIDVGSEPAEVHRLYGAAPGETSFANNCLRARRLIERGARCVQLFDEGWDSHGIAASEALNRGFHEKCRQIDQPITALLQDLQRCGLLEETLVIWSGEFGRSPARDHGNGYASDLVGRDHQSRAFTTWLAGGGVKPGITVGATDPLGALVVDQPVHVRDLNATIFKLLGLDHRLIRVVDQARHPSLRDDTSPAALVKSLIT